MRELIYITSGFGHIAIATMVAISLYLPFNFVTTITLHNPVPNPAFVCLTGCASISPSFNHYNINVYGHWPCTVEPRLSESPLSELSVIQTLFRILKYQETIGFFQKQVINEVPV